MVLTKDSKGKAYFRRLQVQFRRRREGKTDYQARKALIIQDQRSINTPKHRLVVRRTNKDIIAQIMLAQINGDVCVSSAYSHELTKYGIPVGHTNYAACYATGLLLARRLLVKLKLDKLYPGFAEATGEHKIVEAIENKPHPFKAYLDTGLVRTTTGARVFAALKGAVDGGLNIPHDVKRFVGYNPKTKKFDPKILRGHIFGEHVAKHMKDLKANDEDKYKSSFSLYIKNNITAENLAELYKKAHAAIRANPTFVATKKKVPEKDPLTNKIKSYPRQHKFSLNLRRKRFQQKLEAIKKKQRSVSDVLFDS